MTGLFTNGTTLSASALNDAINSMTTNAQTGAGYTLVLADAGKLVTLSNASAQNLTIPLNSSVAYPTGTTIEALNIGAGTWTVTATGGVTLAGSVVVPQYRRVRLTKTGTDTWYSNTLGGGGLVLVASSAFSASSAVSLNGCFTGTYENYRILIYSSTASGTISLNARMRASSTDDTSANYASQYLDGTNTTVSAARSAGGTSMSVGSSSTTGSWQAIDLFRPQLAQPTFFASLSGAVIAAPIATFFTGGHNVSTAYDGITFIPSSSTITGTVRVYGLANS